MSKKLIEIGISQESQETIIEVFGVSFFNNIENNILLIEENIKILKKYNIDYEEMFKLYPDLILITGTTLETKIKKLLLALGEDYEELIEEDTSLFEKMYEL